MSFFAWILLGLLAGFLASKIVNREGSGAALDILLGVVGAVVGGWIFTLLGSGGVSGVNLHSLLVAVCGAIVVLLVYHWSGGQSDVQAPALHCQLDEACAVVRCL